MELSYLIWSHEGGSKSRFHAGFSHKSRAQMPEIRVYAKFTQLRRMPDWSTGPTKQGELGERSLPQYFLKQNCVLLKCTQEHINPILEGGYFMYVGWGVVQNYPKS